MHAMPTSTAETTNPIHIAQNAFGADQPDEQARHARSDQPGQSPHRFVHAVHTLETQPGAARHIGKHRLARGDAHGVEDRTHHRRDQHERVGEHAQEREDRDHGR